MENVWGWIRTKAKAKPLTAAVAGNGLSVVLGLTIERMLTHETGWIGIAAVGCSIVLACFIALALETKNSRKSKK